MFRGIWEYFIGSGDYEDNDSSQFSSEEHALHMSMLHDDSATITGLEEIANAMQSYSMSLLEAVDRVMPELIANRDKCITLINAYCQLEPNNVNTYWDGNTLLHDTAVLGGDVFLEHIFKYKVNFHLKNNMQLTALQLAIKRNKASFIKLVMDHAKFDDVTLDFYLTYAKSLHVVDEIYNVINDAKYRAFNVLAPVYSESSAADLMSITEWKSGLSHKLQSHELDIERFQLILKSALQIMQTAPKSSRAAEIVAVLETVLENYPRSRSEQILMTLERDPTSYFSLVPRDLRRYLLGPMLLFSAPKKEENSPSASAAAVTVHTPTRVKLG